MHFTHRIPLSPPFAALALAMAALPAAAAIPDAGQILQEPRTPLTAPRNETPALQIDSGVSRGVPEGGARVRLAAIRFSGNTAFSTPALQGLLADAVGDELTFAELTRLTDRVTRHYRHGGYLVARAYLPAQAVKDGVLDIVVLEGVLGRVIVGNAAGLKDSALAPLQALTLNAPVQEQSLDQTLLSLADLPGTRAQSTLRPGAAVGASELLIEVSPGRSFEGSAELDNFGSVYTGEYRAGTSLAWNNPLDRGDQLSAQLQVSDAGLHYERLAYQLPLGVRATRAGIAVSNVYYRLGRDFEVLDAYGSAAVASLYLRQPLVRSPSANWFAQLQFDAKALRDTVGSTSTTARRSLRSGTVGMNGDWQDALLGGARSALAVSFTLGGLSMDADSRTQDASSANSAGDFGKLNYQWQRLQALQPGWTLALSVSGQVADKNLASAEKFSLGGSQGVRAYPEGEASGDVGCLASVELRWQAAPGWQLQAFGDAGVTHVNQRPWDDAVNRRGLAGVGLGMTWSQDNLSLTLNAAWPTDIESPQPEPERTPRAWARLATSF